MVDLSIVRSFRIVLIIYFKLYNESMMQLVKETENL